MLKLFSTFTLLIFTSINCYAAEIAGVTFDDRISLNESKQILTLNGAGLRQKFFFDIYAAGLYLEKTSQDVDAILNDSGSKLLVMHILYDSIKQEKMISSTLDSFKDNLSENDFANLSPRINSFIKQYQSLKAGDILIYDYTPNKGTRFSINNQLKGITMGADFNTALLKIWLGKDPASDSLKDALLGLQ